MDVNDLPKYSSMDACLALTDKKLILTIVLIIIIFTFMMSFNAYGQPLYWILMLTCITYVLFAGFNMRELSWLSLSVATVSLMIFVSYLIPYSSTDEVLLHLPLKIASCVLFTLVSVFILGILLSMIPSTSKCGRSIVSCIRI